MTQGHLRHSLMLSEHSDGKLKLVKAMVDTALKQLLHRYISQLALTGQFAERHGTAHERKDTSQ